MSYLDNTFAGTKQAHTVHKRNISRLDNTFKNAKSVGTFSAKRGIRASGTINVQTKLILLDSLWYQGQRFDFAHLLTSKEGAVIFHSSSGIRSTAKFRKFLGQFVSRLEEMLVALLFLPNSFSAAQPTLSSIVQLQT